MNKLSPSILSADFAILGEQIKKVERANVSMLHIDVMDGHFVPNISVGIPVVASIRKITDMLLDVHLMISEPLNYIKAFAKAGADIINIHIEAVKNPAEAIYLIRESGKKAAITIKPETNIEVVYKYLEMIDMVLIMSVEPGYGGQELIEASLDKARVLRDYCNENNIDIDIEMDGGIYLNNLQRVLDAGVNVIVAGSAVFGQNDIEKAVEDFHAIMNKV